MKVKVSSLKHHPKNKEIYTLSSIEELMESISEVGLLQPLIIDSRNQVISGNRRFESVKRLGWEEVEVEVKEVKEGEEELLLIHFNKQRIKSFKELINEYLILDGYYRKGQGRRTDLTSVKSNRSSSRDIVSKEMGISSSQLQRLIFIHKHHPDHIELLDKGILTVNQSYLQIQRELKEKESRESKPNNKSKTTKNSSWRFYQKSSHDMSELNDGEVQTIFTSPPYWNKRKYSEEEGLGNEKTSEEFVVNLSEHLRDCKRVLNERGSFFLNLGDTFYNGNLQNVPHRVVLKLQEQGWILEETLLSGLKPIPNLPLQNLILLLLMSLYFILPNQWSMITTLHSPNSLIKLNLLFHQDIRSVNGEYSNSISPYFPTLKERIWEIIGMRIL